ncbi:MAG: ABC transporter substrate-binding protein [Bacteroidales bacterium]|nr:ABC transporter substrate-binding protein [Bacteroidales bacterium]
MKLKYTVVVVFLILFSCSGNRDESIKGHAESKKISGGLKYAKGLRIEIADNYKIITVLNPWQGASNVEYKYLLIDKNEELPELADEYRVIRTPVEKVVCLSTTHVAFIDVLNKTGTIAGISGTDYVNNQKLRERIANKLVFDVGYDNSLNYELIASLNPDLVITYGIGGEIAGYNQRLKDLGINSVINAEYLEDDPLGKLEWIKFIAAFYGMDNFANEYFESIEKEYNELLDIAKENKSKPKILFGLPWKDVWYVPGGMSYLAKMVNDAGGEYLWKSNDSRKSLPFNIESVFVKASEAEIWLNTGTVNNKQDIIKTDERFKSFKPFNESKIFNNNLRLNQYGGNDYWETGLVQPNIVLKDMIKIFHPDLLPDHQLVYYKQID